MRTLIEQAEYVRAARKMYLGERNSSVGHDQVVIDAYLKNYNKHLDAFADMLCERDALAAFRADVLKEVRAQLQAAYEDADASRDALVADTQAEGYTDGLAQAQDIVETLLKAPTPCAPPDAPRGVWSVCTVDLTYAARSRVAALDSFLVHPLELDRTPKSMWPPSVLMVCTDGEGTAYSVEIIDVPAYVAEHHPSWPTNPR